MLPGGGLSAVVAGATSIVSGDLPAGVAVWARGQTLQIPVLHGSTS